MGTKDDRIGTDGEKKKEVKIEKAKPVEKPADGLQEYVSDLQRNIINFMEKTNRRLDKIEDFLVQYGWKK